MFVFVPAAFDSAIHKTMRLNEGRVEIVLGFLFDSILNGEGEG